MNKVILIGRLTRNPEVRYSQNENSIAVARFTLAVDRRFKRDNEATADFIGCVAFGKTAEFFEKYTRQGSKMAIEGRIQTGSYTKQDGTKVYTTDVVVENAEFADSKPVNPGQGMGAPAGQGGMSQPYGQQGMNQGYSNPNYGQQSYQGNGYQNQGGYVDQGNAGYGNQGNLGYQGNDNGSNYGSQNFNNGYQNQSYDQGGYTSQSAPMQEAADEGFMQIPDELNDEGLPFN